MSSGKAGREFRAPSPIRLGLIGDNISRSRSPDLHRIAGRLAGLDVTYDLFIPRDMGLDFDAVFDLCRASGLHGVNVTYPYKEQVVGRVAVGNERVRRIGSVNTVVFGESEPVGYNTDHSGFLAAFRQRFGNLAPGRVCIVGAGGVGKAVAFGLLELGAEAVDIVDTDQERAGTLAAALQGAGSVAVITAATDLAAAVSAADGVVNCTPLGMVGYPGTAVPPRLLPGRRWAFDAVYTPVETEFKRDAEAAGLDVLSGYELFFNQGIDAFRIFTGRAPSDLAALRAALSEADRAATG